MSKLLHTLTALETLKYSTKELYAEISKLLESEATTYNCEKVVQHLKQLQSK